MGPSRYVAERSRNMRAGVRVAYAASLAVVVGVASSVFTAWQAAMLVGWDAGALLLILWIWIAVAGLLRIARIRGLIDQHLRSRWACEGQVAICHGRYRAGSTPPVPAIACSRLHTRQSRASHINARCGSTR